MLLPLVYLVFTAPPVSIRRLTCLYILAFASAAGLLSLVGAKHVVDLALMTATFVAFAAWVSPPLRFLYGAARSGTLPLGIFDSVSGPVQFTYGFALTIAVGLAGGVPLKTGHGLGVIAMMPALVALASAVGVSTPILIRAELSSATCQRELPGRTEVKTRS
jgi:hypothetical protein